ncbi:MAG: hypothetical protein OHK0017_11050 [Patescibacteria group bacterium]
MAQIPKEWLKILDLYTKLNDDERESFSSSMTPEQREYLEFIYDQCKSFRVVPVKENHHLHGEASDSNPLKKITQDVAEEPEPGALSHFKVQMPASNSTPKMSPFGLGRANSAITQPLINHESGQEVLNDSIKVDMGNRNRMVFPKNNLIPLEKPSVANNISQSQPVNPHPDHNQLPGSNAIVPQQQNRQMARLNAQNIFSKVEYKKQKQKEKVAKVAQVAVIATVLLAIPITAIYFILNNKTDTVSGALANFTSVNGKDTSDTAYNKWMDTIPRDKTINRDKTADPDSDGLTNFEEFQLGSFPDSFSSCANKRGDGDNLLNSIDPVSCKTLNFNDVSVTNKYDSVVTRQTINDRLSLVALDGYRRKKVAGASETVASVTDTTISDTSSSSNQSISPADLVDTSKPAELTIPKLSTSSNINAVPVQWLEETTLQSLEKSMQSGVVHYPGTSLPTETGTVYISGRSVDINHPDNKFGNIFSELDKLEAEDLIELKITMQDGTHKKFIYRVRKMNTVKASDSKQFESIAGKKEIALTTGWPKVSNEQRLILRAGLDKVEVVE